MLGVDIFISVSTFVPGFASSPLSQNKAYCVIVFFSNMSFSSEMFFCFVYLESIYTIEWEFKTISL